MALAYFITFISTLSLCCLLTRLIRNTAVAKGWVSHPVSGRHVHTTAVPRLGGLAVYVSVWLAVAIDVLFHGCRETGNIPLQALGGLFVCSTLVFLLGVVDDIHPLASGPKFAVQIAAATLLYLSGFRISQLQLLAGGSVLAPALGFVLTVFWILLITNAFNLIDGLDGLAAGSAFFSTLVVFFFSLSNGHHFNSIITIAIAGAILGFLRFNFNPATIFLGDCGSLFIGFLLSALALESSDKAPTMVAVAVPVVTFGLPIVDVGLSIFRRFISRKPLFSADGEHIHHRLLKRGLTHRNAVIVLYAVSAAFAVVSVAIGMPARRIVALALVAVSVAVIIGIQQLQYLEVNELGRVALRTLNQRTIIANNMRIRRTTEALNSCSGDSFWRLLVEALEPIGFDAISLDVKLNARIPLLLRGSGSDGKLLIRLSDRKEEGFAWSVLLTLRSSNSKDCGFLGLHRLATDVPLKMDINLLANGFTTAVSDALVRLILEEEEALVVPSNIWAAAATAAGDD